MNSYSLSPVKVNNRAFKLRHAKRSLRTAKLHNPISIYTLCGDSVWSENALYEYAMRKWDYRLPIYCFNTTSDELDSAKYAALFTNAYGAIRFSDKRLTAKRNRKMGRKQKQYALY